MESHLQLSSEIGIGSTFISIWIYKQLMIMSRNYSYKLIKILLLTILLFKLNNRLEALKVMLVEDNKINMLLLKTIIKTSFPKPLFMKFQTD
jgi:hypothetical protein